MAIGECRGVESREGNNLGDLDLNQPLVIKKDKIFAHEDGDQGSDKGGSIGMVLVSTFAAVCGSFEFGSCVSTILKKLPINILVPFEFLFDKMMF